MMNRLRSISPIFLAIAAVLLFNCFSFAQNISGTILGTITDASGANVPGALTVVVNQDTNARYTAVDESGEYTATNLPPGTYSVRTELNGFKPNLINNVVLLANRSVRLN